MSRGGGQRRASKFDVHEDAVSAVTTPLDSDWGHLYAAQRLKFGQTSGITFSQS